MTRATVDDIKDVAHEYFNNGYTKKEIVELLNNMYDEIFYLHKDNVWIDCSDRGCKNILIL